MFVSFGTKFRCESSVIGDTSSGKEDPAKVFASSGAWSLSDDKEGFGRDPPNHQGAKRRQKVVYLRVTRGTCRDPWAMRALPHVASASFPFRLESGLGIDCSPLRDHDRDVRSTPRTPHPSSTINSGVYPSPLPTMPNPSLLAQARASNGLVVAWRGPQIFLFRLLVLDGPRDTAKA